MARVYNITEWNVQPWVSTGGTRSKKYVQGPDGKYYYFKMSLKKPEYEYFFEFWNEVISAKLGQTLGFNMLQYDIAIYGNDMGCISESMILPDGEELVEGGKYMQAYENRFAPDVKNARRLYSFQLIERTLDEFKPDYIQDFVELIIFDAIIGNGDRHQENWAFINELTYISGALKKMEDITTTDKFEILPNWLQKIIRKLYASYIDFENKIVRPEAKNVQIYFHKIKCFAPVYDSGSSLARELSEEKIETMLRDEQQFNSYVSRGKSEIHWHNEKINHFELVANLLESAHTELAQATINRVVKYYSYEKLEQIIYNIDNEVPEAFVKFKLSKARKRLIIKLVASRLQKLKSLLDERV